MSWITQCHNSRYGILLNEFTKKNYLASGDQENVKQWRRPMVVVVNYYGPAVNEFTDESTHSALHTQGVSITTSG